MEPELERVQESRDLVIELRLETSAHIKIVIVNRFNTIIRTIDYGIMGPSIQELEWDEKDDNGERLFPGVYFILISVDGEQYTYIYEHWVQDLY